MLGDDEYDYLDISPTATYRVWDKGEKLLAAKIDNMLTHKMQGDEIMTSSGRWNEKFVHYSKEAANFLAGLAVGRIPPGFDKMDIAELKSIMRKYKLEGEMYKQAAVELNQVEALMITHTIERIADVNERIGSEREKIAMQQEKERNDRAARGRGGRGGRGRLSGPSAPAKGE